MNRVFSFLVLSSIVACALALPACTAEVLDEGDDETTAPIAPAPAVKAQGIVVPQHPGRTQGDAATAPAEASVK